LYQPKGKPRTVVAFAAALLIHFAAIGIASVHRSHPPAPPGPSDKFTDITFEPASAPDELPPEAIEPVAPPSPNEYLFQDETQTPPLVRKAALRPASPLVRPRASLPPGKLNWSSAKVLALNAPRPEYPYEARRQKITGKGVVEMQVDEGTGNVTGVVMRESTGNPFLDNAALSAFRRWRFKPGTVSSVTCPITFTLTGASY
jgi:TonB family protein